MSSRPLRSAATVVASLALAVATVAVSSPVSASASSASTASTVAPAAAAGDPGERAAAKLTKGVQQELADGARADYWVRFAPRDPAALVRPDGSTAAGDWKARGRAVYDGLRAAARTSQRDVRAALDARGVDYTAYWISDAILVRDGTLGLATALAGESEVTQIRPTTSWRQDKPVAQPDAWTDTGTVPWGVKDIHADQVWAEGVDGTGVTVANLDSGVDVTHPALRGRYRGLQPDGSLDNDYSFFDVAGVCPSTDPCDGDGHGTHTMGTMLGSAPGHQVGVAPGASWIAVNGCAGGQCSDEDLMGSGQWLLAPTRTDGTGADPDRRPQVVNNSWGSDPGSSGNPFYDEILDAWDAAGIFSSWSIGNSGPSCGTAAAPGGRSTAYSVGAYGPTGDLAFFSSRGPGQDGRTKPDITAPGMGVVSSLPGGTYGPEDGTSMAAPHVAGSVALLWSARPEMVGDIAGTRKLLDLSAHDVDDTSCGGTAADNPSWGEGRLDAAALVAAAPAVFGRVTGAVVDAAGNPVPRASVTASGDTPRTVTGHTDGTFSLPLPPGSYTVTVAASGYRSTTRTVTVPADGGAVALGTIALATAPRHTVSGTLTQPGGFPVVDTRVTLGPDVAAATTDAEGAFTFTDVPEGTYTLRVSASVCGDPVAERVVVDGDETLHPVQGTQAGPGYLGCRRTAGGFRTGTDEHRFVDGASLTQTLPFGFVWFGRSVSTIAISPKGYLRFDPAPPDPRDQPVTDNYGFPDSRLGAAVAPFFDDLQTAAVYTRTTTVDGQQAYVVEWRDATLTPDTHPDADPSATMDFSVTLTADGDATIGWGPGVGADAATSGSSATIGFQSGPDPGQALTPVELGRNQPVATQGRGFVLDAEPTAFVHVTVTDANDDQPLIGARVRLTPQAGPAGAARTLTTDRSGVVDAQLPLGTWTVATDARHYTDSTTTVALTSEAQKQDVTASLATSVATVKAPQLEWLVGPQDSGTGKVKVTNSGTEPMTVSFAESARNAAVDKATAGRAAGRAAAAGDAGEAGEAAAPPTMRRTRLISSWKAKYDSNGGIAYDGTSLWTNELYGQHVAQYTFDGKLKKEMTAAWDQTFSLLSVGDLAFDSTTGHLCEAIHGPEGGELRCYSRTDGTERIAIEGSWTPVSPGGLAYNGEDDVFYLSGNGYLFTIQGTTHPSPGRVLRTCHLPIQDSRGLAYNPATGTVWEAGVRQDYPGFRSPRFDELQELMPETCEVVSTASVPESIGMTGGLDIDPAGRLWMAGPSGGTVNLLDVDTVVTTDLPWLTVPSGTATLAPGTSRTFTVGVRGAKAKPGVLAGAVVVRTSSGRAVNHLVPVTLNRSAYRVGVEAGGRTYRDAGGFTWSSDRKRQYGGWGYSGRTTTVRTSGAISGTTEDGLFRSARVGRTRSFSYSFASVPAGSYGIDLGFAEIAGARPGRRVFDVRVDGRTVLRGVDAARSGQRRALVKALRVEHRKGALTVTFTARQGSAAPMVSSVRVTERPDW
jgi:subtilisin family serine protease